jgi:hypothetical protein
MNKQNSNDYHSFTWTQDNKLIINGKSVNPNDWEIVEVEIITSWPIPLHQVKDK